MTVYKSIDDLMKEVKSLLSDIDSMRAKNTVGKYWYGGFSEFNVVRQEAFIEWPNLSITTERVKLALKNVDVEINKEIGDLT